MAVESKIEAGIIAKFFGPVNSGPICRPDLVESNDNNLLIHY